MQGNITGSPSKWVLLIFGEYKINCDAAFKDRITVTGCVLRNHLGLILGAWTCRFVSDNAFCAESKAVVQALQQASKLQLEKVTI